MKMKKLMAIAVAMVLFVTAMMSFVGCGSKADETTQTTSAGGSTTTTQAPKEPVELTLYNAYGIGNTQEDWFKTNPLGKKIEELSNVIMKFEFPTVSSGDPHDKLNLLIAAGTYPDIIYMGKDEILAKIIEEKISLPLNSLIDQYGPNIKESYGDVLERIKWDDGNIYYLTTDYGQVDNSGSSLPPSAGHSFNYRKDIYEAVGSPDISTLSGIYDFVVKMQEKFPTNTDGQKAYPIGGFVQSWQNMTDTLIVSAGGNSGRYYVDDNDQLYFWTRAPWAETIVKFYNRVYREGLIDPEAFTMNRSTWQKEKLGVEKMWSYFGNGWMGTGAEATFAERGKPNALFESVPFKVEGGQTPKLVEINPIGNKQLIITDKCKDPEAAIKWMDTLAQLNFEITNGVEGGIWDMVDGKPKLHDDIVAKYNAGSVLDEEFSADTGFGMYKFMAKTVGSTQWGTAWILKDDFAALGNQRAIERQKRFIGTTYDVVPFAKLLKGADESLSQAYSIINERMMNEFYRMVFAETESACMQEFEKFKNDLDTLGLKDLEKYWNIRYQQDK